MKIKHLNRLTVRSAPRGKAGTGSACEDKDNPPWVDSGRAGYRAGMRALSGLRMTLRALMVIAAMVTYPISPATAAFLSPTIIGDIGDYCDTSATAFDVFKYTTSTKFLIGGLTYSERMVQGATLYTHMKACSSVPIPFFQVWNNQVVYGERFFTDMIKIGSTLGKYTKVTAVSFPDRYTLATSFNWFTVVVALEFGDLSGSQLNVGTTIMYYKMTSPIVLFGVYTVNHPALSRSDFAFYNLQTNSISHQRFEFFNRESSPKLFETLYIDMSSSKSLVSKSFSTATLEAAYGATVMMKYRNDLIMVGSMKIPGRTGFIPVMYDRNKNSVYYMEPASDTQPFYTIDKIEWNKGHFLGMWGFGAPRDANYNLLNSAHPIQIFRHHYGGATTCTGSLLYFVGYYVTLKTNEPDKFIVPLDVNYLYPDYVKILFWKTTTLQTDMVLDGTLNNYLGYAQAPMSTWCKNGGTESFSNSFGGTHHTLTNTEQSVAWDAQAYLEFYGRPCYTPTGVTAYCTMIDAGFNGIGASTHPVVYATTQDRIYNDKAYHEVGIFDTTDSVAHITYPNGDGTNNGKFITVQHTLDTISTNNVTLFATLPDWGREYTKLYWNYEKTYHEAPSTTASTTLSTLTVAECDSNTYTIGTSTASGVLAAGRQRIQVYTDDALGDYLSLVQPFTFTCTGSHCDRCPFKIRILASETTDTTLSQNAARIPRVTLLEAATNKLLIPFVNKAQSTSINIRLLAYSINFYQTYKTQKSASEFWFGLTMGLTYPYPSCGTLCTSSDGNQIAMRLYQYSNGACYEALTHCSGCLGGTDPTHLRSITCPSRVCQANDTLAVSYNLTLDLDVTDLPMTFDITQNITNPTNLTLDLLRIGNGTHLSYVALNSTYDGLFTLSGTQLTINSLATSLEFPMETFEVEVKSSTCSHLDNTIVAEANALAAGTQDTEHNLPTVGIKFQMQLIRCGLQNLTLTDSTPKYFELQKDTGSIEILSSAAKTAMFALSQATFCPITQYSLSDENQNPFTVASVGRRLAVTGDEAQAFLKLSTWDQAGPVVIDTSFTQTTNELQKILKFVVSAETSGKTRFNQVQHQPITVVIGCFSEPQLVVSVKALPAVVIGQPQEVFQQPEAAIPGSAIVPHVKIRLFKELDSAAAQVQTYNLTELITWDTSVSNCFASNLTMYNDAEFTQLQTGTDVYLNVNPLNKDANGIIDPVLTVNKSTAFNKLVYLKGTTNSGAHSDVFKMNVIVCGEETVDLSTETEMKIRQFALFNIQWNQEENQPEWEVFNLTGLFRISSTPDNVLADDCPIDHFVVCTSSVTDCTKDTNITSSETFIVNKTGSDHMLYIRRAPLEKQTFKLTASTRSGQKSTQTIGLQVCGKESITVNTDYMKLNSRGVLNVNMDMDLDNNPTTFDLSKVFNNDLPECPIVKFLLVKEPKLGSDEINQNQKINYVLDESKGKFEIVPVIQSTLKFYLMAITASGKFGTVEVSSKIFKIIPPPNLFPSYPELQERVNIEVIYDEHGNLTTTDLRNFTSGPLEDPENDESVVLEIENRLAYVTTTLNEDGSFEVQVDPSLVEDTDAGCQEIKVKLNDSAHQFDEFEEVTQKICINITREEPEPELQEPSTLTPPPPPPDPVETTFSWDWEALDKESTEEKEEVQIIEIEPEIEEVWVPLLCEISITTLGKVTFGCNQPIKVEKLLQSTGRRLKELGDSFFSLTMEPGAYEGNEKQDLSQLEFVWELEEYDDFNNALMIQVNFTNAIAISPDVVPDVLTVDVVDPTVIESKKYGKPLEMNGQPIATGVKKQMPNTLASQRFDGGTQTTNNAISGTAILTFLLNFIFTGAMKEIIGSILGLQIILFGSLIYVKMPGNIATYYQRLKPIATFNIVVALQKVTDYIFNYDTPEQIRLRENIIATAQDLSILYHNALKNLGNFLFLLGFYFSKVWKLAWLYIKRAVVSDKQKVKAFTFQIGELKKVIFFNQIIQITTAGFIPISIAIYFQYKGSLFSTFGEVCGVIAGVVSFVVAYLLLPFALVQAIVVSKETLLVPTFKQRWGASYAGIKTETRWQRAHKLIFVLRRFALLYIGLELHEIPPIQLILLNLMNIFSIIYIGNNEPLPTPKAMKLELCNEAMVSSITYHLFMFTDALPNQNAQYLIGWSLVVNLTLMLSVNSFFVIKGILNKLRLILEKNTKVMNLKKNMKQMVQVQMENKGRNNQKAMFIQQMKMKRQQSLNKQLKDEPKVKQATTPTTPLPQVSKISKLKQRKQFKLKRSLKKKTNLSTIQEEPHEGSIFQTRQQSSLSKVLSADQTAEVKKLLVSKMMEDSQLKMALYQKFKKKQQEEEEKEKNEEEAYNKKLVELIEKGMNNTRSVEEEDEEYGNKISKLVEEGIQQAKRQATQPGEEELGEDSFTEKGPDSVYEQELDMKIEEVIERGLKKANDARQVVLNISSSSQKPIQIKKNDLSIFGL